MNFFIITLDDVNGRHGARLTMFKIRKARWVVRSYFAINLIATI